LMLFPCMMRPFLYGVCPGSFLPVKTARWLWACENCIGDDRLFLKDAGDHDLELLFRRQREKRDAEVESKMP